MWAALIDRIDYHRKKWYECDGDGDWQEITIGRVYGLLDALAPDADAEKLVRLFRQRDSDARARDTKAQQKREREWQGELF